MIAIASVNHRSRPHPLSRTVECGADGGFSALYNLRREDGELRCRPGSVTAETFPENIRAAAECRVGGSAVLIVVAGDTVYAGTGASRAAVGTVGTSSGRASVFDWGGSAYLLDGADYYRYDGTSVTRVGGDVPLLCTYDPPNYTMCEERNRLTDRVRMRVPSASSGGSYRLYGNAVSVQAATLNGSPCSYTVSGSGTQTNVKNNGGNGVFEVWYTLSDAGYRGELLRGASAAVWRTSVSVAVLYGGNGVFCSGLCGGAPSPAYFPLSGSLTVGDGTRETTAAVPQYGRMLVFTENATFRLEEPAVTEHNGLRRLLFTMRPVSSGIGCILPDGAVGAGDSPFVATSVGIVRWKESALPSEAAYTVVSEEVAGRLTAAFLGGAVCGYDVSRGEYWIASGSDVLVLPAGSGRWTAYGGLPTEGFASVGGQWHRYAGKKLYRMDDGLTTDDGVPVAVSAETPPLDFDLPHMRKRLYRAFAVCAASSAEIALTFADDVGETKSVTVRPDAAGAPKRAEAFLPRFTSLRVAVTGSGNVRLRLLTLLYAAGGEAR